LKIVASENSTLKNKGIIIRATVETRKTGKLRKKLTHVSYKKKYLMAAETDRDKLREGGIWRRSYFLAYLLLHEFGNH